MTPPTRPGGPSRWRRGGDESGIVLVWFALMITVFLLLAALSVDVGRWYVNDLRLQRAADAAALAGAAHLPEAQCPTGPVTLTASGNQGCPAYTVAESLAAANGFVAGVNGVVTTASVGGNPATLTVSITNTVHNFFASAFGFATQRLNEVAGAQFDGPSQMGSPCNTFGKQPPADPSYTPTGATNFSDSACKSSSAQLWVNVAGPGATKVSGDQYTSDQCGSPGGALPGVYDCNRPGNPQTDPGTNADFNPDGYFYTSRIGAAGLGNGLLTVDVYDPAFVYQGDTCTSVTVTEKAAMNPYDAAGNRYGTGAFCTGDQLLGTNDPVTTTYEVLAVPTGADPAKYENVPVAGCSMQWAGQNLSSQQLTDALTAGSATYQMQLAREFHQWVNLCKVAPVAGTDYVTWVRTDVPPDAGTVASGYEQLPAGGWTTPANPTATPGGGHNRIALRSAIVSGAAVNATASSAISLFASARMALYANTSGLSASFYLVRVPSGYHGKTVTIDLFDIGDAAQPVSLTVVPPPDSGASSTSCVASGPVSGSLPTCSFTATPATHNGQLQVLNIPLPSTYACTDATTTGCWFTISYTTASSISDTTTWSAHISGDPVRLVR